MTTGRAPRLLFAGVFFLVFAAGTAHWARAQTAEKAAKPPSAKKAKPKGKSVARATPIRQPAWGSMPAAQPVSLGRMQKKHWLTPTEAVARHRQGLAAEQAGDDPAALQAFLDAAESGHGPAQFKLGEIYDRGNSAVERDYATALGWYQRAREQGVAVPKPHTFPAGR